MQQFKKFRSRYAKVVLLAFAAVYLTFAIGVLVSTHYCMGRTSSVAVFSAEPEKCACELFTNKVNHHCCHDEHEVIQLDDQHQVLSYHLNVPHIYILGDLYTERLVASASLDLVELLSIEDDTSPPSSVPIFKKNCSFVFYDEVA
jgi:hypothetical protein